MSEPKQVSLRAAIIAAAALVAAALTIWNAASGLFGWKFTQDRDVEMMPSVQQDLLDLQAAEIERRVWFKDAYKERAAEDKAAQRALQLLREGKLQAVEE